MVARMRFFGLPYDAFDGLARLVVLPDVVHQLPAQVGRGFEDACTQALAVMRSHAGCAVDD